MRNESEMPSTLLDFIRKLGLPKGLFSDSAKVQIGKTIQTILCMYCIDDMQSEPHPQHQNPDERRIQDIKKASNHIMDPTGTPSHFAGTAEHQGDAMTWLILDEVTQQVLCCSAIQTALDPNNTRIRGEHNGTTEDFTPENGENEGHYGTSSLQLPKFSPDKLIGKTFACKMDDGNTYRAQIIQKMLDHDAANHQNIKFTCQVRQWRLC
jgi:hypothetical protein